MAVDKVSRRKMISAGVLASITALSICTIAIPPTGPIMDVNNPTVAAFNAPPTNPDNTMDKGDISWMLVSSALVLFMTPGLAFFYGGMVRAKNLISTLLQSFIAMGIISLLWTFVGFSLSFGETCRGFIGNPKTYFFYKDVGAAPNPGLTSTIPLVVYSVFQLKFAIITPALVSGAIAERVRFTSYMIYITLFHIFIYCPLAHLVWSPNGLLHKYGILDFAGGTVVHMSSGYAALAASYYLGPRLNPPTKMQPSNIPFVMLGTSMLWFGWMGFNAGSALSANALAGQAFLNTNTAAASAMMAFLFMEHINGGKTSAVGACVGAVVGLVAITPAAGYVTVGGAACTGILGAVICNIAGHLINHRTTIDDTLDVWPCHGLGGTVGMIATSLFSTKTVNSAGIDGAFYGNPWLLGNHLLALLAVVPYILVMSYIMCRLTDLIYPMRVSSKSEMMGLDMTQHNETIMLETGEDYDLDKTGEMKKDADNMPRDQLSAITINN